MLDFLCPSILHIRNDSRALLVWFAGLHEPFLNPAFLASDRPLDGLFLTDTGFDWYMPGLPDVPGGFPESVAWLKAFLADHRYDQVFLAGQSSGGYAALRFARALNPAAVIAFAPQTRNIGGQPQVELEDLADVYRGWAGEYPIRIHVARSEKDNKSEYFWDDWEQLRPFLDMDNMTIIRHPFDRHAISLPLHARGLFYRTVLADISLYLKTQERCLPQTAEISWGPKIIDPWRLRVMDAPTGSR